MLQARGELDLAPESLLAHRRRELGREHFHDDEAVERDLARDEHARHPAPAELVLEGVRIAERALELRPEIGAHAGGIARGGIPQNT